MDQHSTSSGPKVELVASTRNITARDAASTAGSAVSVNRNNDGDDNNDDDGVQSYFESAQWTADGTTILTYSSSNLISGYIVPEDLLAPDKPAPLPLTPQAAIQLPEPSNAIAAAPYFSLAEPYTNQVLASARDHPIQLFYLSSTPSPSPSSSQPSSPPPAASYPFTKTSRSETFLSATSLIWPTPGSHFIAGSRSLLAKFDVSRPGASSEPIIRVKTIPSERHLLKGGGVGMRGTVSALGAQPPDSNYSGLVAAGTWTRWIGLYDFGAAGECVAAWSVASAAGEFQYPSSPSPGNQEGDKEQQQHQHHPKQEGIGGSGITQTIWSPCGRYLLIAERKSRGMLVYDVRVTGRLLGCLTGRDTADSNQRVSCDVFPGSSSSPGGGGGDGEAGFEVWSGAATGSGGGGVVKVWEGVGAREGAHEPSWAWRAYDDASTTVGAACVHPSGSVVATCAGSWAFTDDDNDDDDDGSQSSSSSTEMAWMRRRNRESSLKIWSISANNQSDDHDGRGVSREPVEGDGRNTNRL